MGAGVTTEIERSVPWERIRLTPTPGGIPRTRHFLRLEGTSVGDDFAVHNNNLKNACRAVRERVFAVEVNGELRMPPKPLEGALLRLGPFRALLLRRLGRCTPWTTTQFVESYTGSKRVRYDAASKSLRTRDVERRDAKCAAFVKLETVNLTAKVDPAARLIQPRGARFNVRVGRYIRPLEHRCYEAIDRVFGGPTVMSRYNAVQVAGHMFDMWLGFKVPIAVLLDASRFDQHVSRAVLEWEHSVYLGAYGGNKELARLLRWQLKNFGCIRTDEGVLEYEVDGCRMSGDMNTGLGNKLIMCAMVYAYSVFVGVCVRLANNGDDCAVILEAADETRFVAGIKTWFREMGFTMKVDGIAREFEHIEFCQTRPDRKSVV